MEEESCAHSHEEETNHEGSNHDMRRSYQTQVHLHFG